MPSDIRELARPSEDDRIVEGWKQIALVLDIHVNTAQLYARRNKDPLPVYVNHRGPVAYVSALREWERRQVIPYQVHLRQRDGDRRRSRHGAGSMAIDRSRRPAANGEPKLGDE